MSVPQSMHLPCALFAGGKLTSVLVFGEPGFEFCISRYKAGIAVAGGAITDGGGGTKRGVTGVAGVANGVN